MQMLVVLVLSALVSSLAEGRIVTKCEVRDKLMEALPHEGDEIPGLTYEDFMAKMVCHVEKSSGFDTSVVTALKPGEVSPAYPPGPAKRKRRGAGPGGGKAGMRKYKDKVKKDSKEDSREDSIEDSIEASRYGSKEDSSEGPRFGGYGMDEVWNLYGIFQFSDHVICSAGPDAQTPNLCGMNCTDLLDDDITDDINCIETIKETMEGGSVHNEALKRMFMLLFQWECYMVTASDYFSDCQGPV